MPLLGHDDQQQVVGMGEEVAEIEVAISLLRPAVADGQQPGQPPPAMARRGISNDVGRGIGEHQPSADNQLEINLSRQRRPGLVAGLIERDPGADHPGDAVAVGDADPGHVQFQCLCDHVRRMRCPAQEAVIGRGDQLGEVAHANSPWRYQPGSGFSS